jgi:hypothetical protein
MWYLWTATSPLVVKFSAYHAGDNPDWWCIVEPWDWYSYVVLPNASK